MAEGKGFPNLIVAEDIVDRRIAQGLVYVAAANDPFVASDESLEVLIITPPDIRVAASANSLYGSLASLQVFENTIVTDNGIPVQAINYNRVPHPVTGIRPAQTTVFHDPTITDDGDPLFPEILLPGGAQGQNTSGGVYETLFFVLEPETNYMIRVTNLSNTDSVMTSLVNFAELIGPASSGT